MLFPKKVKFRKWQRQRRNMSKIGVATRGTDVAFGSFALKTLSYGRIRSNQIEAARKVMRRSMGKTGKIWIRIFPDRPYTSKPAEVPMGKGKGEVDGYEVEVLPGRILFEVDGVSEANARETLRKAAAKLPIKGNVVAR